MVLKRGQSAMEFIILIGFLLVAFVVFMLVIQENMEDRTDKRQNTQIIEIALSVKNEVDLAYQSSDGYVREFELEKNPYGGGYEVRIEDNLVFVNSVDWKHAISLAVPNVTGDVNKEGINIIKKENGQVILNP